MKYIEVYHSVWKYLLLAFTCIAIAVLCIVGIYADMSYNGPYSRKIIIASAIVLGLGGIAVLYIVLQERLRKRPYLVITDTKVIVNSRKPWEIPFANVKSFYLTSLSQNGKSGNMICICYKRSVETKKMTEAGRLERNLREMNVRTTGSQESISADMLMMKPQELCDLLNEKLAHFQKRA